MTANDVELKKKELERLLSEKKIDANQYLEVLAKLEESLPTSEAKSLNHGQAKVYELFKTNFLLIAFLSLIVVGWFIAILNPMRGYTSTSSGYEIIGYPYSPIGLGILMCSIILLSVEISCRWVKSISRGAFIILEVMGWFFVIFALYVLANSFSYVWVWQSPYSWYGFISIDPFTSSFCLFLWFIGVFTVSCGLAPLRKWFNKSVG